MFHKTPSGSLLAARAGSPSFRRDHLPGRGEVLFAAMQGYFTLGAPWTPSDEGLGPVSTHQLNSYGVDQHFLIVSAIGADALAVGRWGEVSSRALFNLERLKPNWRYSRAHDIASSVQLHQHLSTTSIFSTPPPPPHRSPYGFGALIVRPLLL